MAHETDLRLLLEQYRSATSAGEVERLLAEIVDGVARPLVTRIVSSAMARDLGGPHDAEDVVADTLSDLLRRLRQLRDEDAAPIHDLRGYIATCAYNRCHEELRARYPARNRLRNQLQYLCGHHPQLAVWRSSRGEIVCGLAQWTGREPAGAAAADRVNVAARSDPHAENRTQLLSLVPLVFREAGAPLELNALVATIARLIDLEHQQAERPVAEDDLQAELRADDALVLRTTLRTLWEDVRRLAPQQRVALLLNLRDAQGNDCVSLLPVTRTATMAEIAAALEMPPGALAAIWNDLPLPDAKIAELLNVTPRQVIKLRRLARERLRRMELSRRNQNLRLDFDSPPGDDLALATRGRSRR